MEEKVIRETLFRRPGQSPLKTEADAYGRKGSCPATVFLAMFANTGADLQEKVALSVYTWRERQGILVQLLRDPENVPLITTDLRFSLPVETFTANRQLKN